MRRLAYIDSPLGRLGLAENNGALTHLFFAPGKKAPAGALGESSPFLEACAAALDGYFSGRRTHFDDIPLAPEGTPFQQRIWAALRAIPYGETRSYKAIAEAAGCPRGFRAVGMANNKNPIAVIIPCHRVIGSDGSLTGYAGGLKLKRFLLDLEREGAKPPLE